MIGDPYDDRWDEIDTPNDCCLAVEEDYQRRLDELVEELSALIEWAKADEPTLVEMIDALSALRSITQERL